VEEDSQVTERELSKAAARRLAIIQHVEEVTVTVAMKCRYFGNLAAHALPVAAPIWSPRPSKPSLS